MAKRKVKILSLRTLPGLRKLKNCSKRTKPYMLKRVVHPSHKVLYLSKIQRSRIRLELTMGKTRESKMIVHMLSPVFPMLKGVKMHLLKLQSKGRR
jgi:hypothetical protein